MSHILERFLIHLASSTFLTLAFFYILKFWLSHNAKVGNFLSSRRAHLIVMSALLVFSLLTLREPFDVAFGTQVWYKAITDQLSWFLGCAISAWGLYRFGGKE